MLNTHDDSGGPQSEDSVAPEARPSGGLDPELGLLRTFAVAARSRSLTEASVRLGLTQPGLSRRIARLERSVGGRLLDRSRGRLRPTPDGEVLLEAADRILNEVDSAMGRLAGRRRSITGELHLHASSIPGEHLLPPLVASFLALHPEAGIRLEVSRTATVIDSIAKGDAVLGVCGDRIERHGVEFRPLVRDVLVLAVPEGHPFARRSSVGIGELAHRTLLTREAGSGTQRVIESLIVDAKEGQHVGPGAGAPTRAFGSTQSILAAVRAGIGLALVSGLAIPSSPGVRGVRVDGMDRGRWFWLATSANTPTTVVAAAFVDHLQRHLGRGRRDP